MDQALIAEYSPGGDLYQKIVTQYGQDVADRVAAAAAQGDKPQIGQILAIARNGPNLNTSTASIFAQEILTDPLAAPLADANKLVENSVISFLKNPWVLAAGATILFFTVFDGVAILKSQASKLKA